MRLTSPMLLGLAAVLQFGGCACSPSGETDGGATGGGATGGGATGGGATGGGATGGGATGGGATGGGATGGGATGGGALGGGATGGGATGGGGTTGGGGGSSTYTPTHFVAPFAQVTGATSDTDSVNGTPFASATSPATPCTLGEAMAEAQPGNIVQVAPGVYTGEHMGGRWDPVFAPVHSGTANAPIIFFAQFPAAYHTTQRSEVRHTGTAGPVMGFSIGETDASDVIFDGFYVDSSQNEISPSGGTVQFHRATRCAYRRFYFDQNTEWGTGTENWNMIFAASNEGCVVSDTVFQSTGQYNPHHNLASIEMYDSSNLTVEHCEFRDTGVGVFVKGDNPAISMSNSATIRFNTFTGLTSNSIELGTSLGAGSVAYQNLAFRNRAGGIRFENSGGGYRNNRFYNNTIQGGLMIRAVDGDFTGGNQVFNNIIFDGLIDSDYDNDVEVLHDYGVDFHNPFDYFTLADYNVFWRSDGRAVYISGNEAIFVAPLSVTQWQAALADAGVPLATRQLHSIESSPGFVNLAGNDYHLAPNGQPALTASNTGGPVGCYITGTEELGLRANPTY